MQPVDQFAKELPGYARSIAKLGTDVAAKWDTLTGKGDGGDDTSILYGAMERRRCSIRSLFLQSSYPSPYRLSS